MAYRKVILKSAQGEYREIVAYSVEVLKSPQAAVHFMNEFDYQLDLIAETPRAVLFVAYARTSCAGVSHSAR